MILAISFIMALFICTAMVPVMMKLAPSLRLVDQPDHRKVHDTPIPRAGGVAIVLAFFVPVLVWYQGGQSIAAVLIGAGIIAVFGFLDDRHNLKYQWKFAAQFIAVGVFLAGNLEITKTPFLGLGDVAPWISYPVLALFILGVTNAINLSDGLDGLAAGTSFLSLAFIAFLSYSIENLHITLLAVSCMGAITGFLRFNTYPAKIFMGDTGSQFLGYITACLAVLVTQSPQTPVSPIIAILIVGLPILDTLMVMSLRLRSGDSPFQPDKRHMHHQLLKAGLEHYQAVAVIYVVSVAMLTMAYGLRFYADWQVFFAYLFFGLTIIFLLRFAQHSEYALKKRERLTAGGERRNPFFRELGHFHARGENYVQIVLGLVCCIYMLAASTNSIANSFIYALLGLVVIGWWNLQLHRREFPMLNRIFVYLTCVVAIYLGVYEQAAGVPAWKELTLLDLSLALLVLVLAIAIRTTRRDQFRLDNQDLLVLIIVLVAPVISSGGVEGEDVARALVRLVIVLYAAEFVISKVQRPVILARLCLLCWLALSVKAIL